MEILLPGSNAWPKVKGGESFEVPAKSEFKLKIVHLADYGCSHLKLVEESQNKAESAYSLCAGEVVASSFMMIYRGEPVSIFWKPRIKQSGG